MHCYREIATPLKVLLICSHALILDLQAVQQALLPIMPCFFSFAETHNRTAGKRYKECLKHLKFIMNQLDRKDKTN